MSSVLSLTGLSYRYPGATEDALHSLDLALAPGELVVVAGVSGSGKSTLMRLASGLVPHFHGGSVSGRALVCGRDVRDCGPAELSPLVGTVLQDPETQVLLGTPRAELAFPLENRGWASAAVARAVEETALALGMADLLDRSTGELSGGELQRVALGAALGGRPRLLCLDEPTSQLDPVAGDELIGLLRRLNEDLDTAILLAEHRLERCLPAADRVVALDRGRIVCDGTPSDFLAWAGSSMPQLCTPGGRILAGLGLPPVPGVRGARAALRRAGRLADPGSSDAPPAPSPRAPRDPALTPRAPRDPALTRRRRTWAPKWLQGDRLGARVAGEGAPALVLDGIWREVHGGRAVLRDLSLAVRPGERVALMGRNGAGKSTLLRVAAGLLAPTRGSVRAGGRVALLLQNPGDYLVHDEVAAEASAAARSRTGVAGPGFDRRHPRELSGGERQRLALAVVLDDAAGEAPAVVCLDEPTRGMDRAHREALAALLARLPGGLLVATHDPEFAATVADRVVLLGDGRVLADGTAQDILSGGTYFATEAARVTGGQTLLPDAAIDLLADPPAPAPVEVRV